MLWIIYFSLVAFVLIGVLIVWLGYSVQYKIMKGEKSYFVYRRAGRGVWEYCASFETRGECMEYISNLDDK